MSWRAAHRLLVARLRAAPAAVQRALTQPLPALPVVPAAARAILVTGTGSSAAHAALLAHLLADRLGLPARHVPLGAFITPPARRATSALIVFSQGLSPNAQLALAEPDAWLGVTVVTAVPPRTPDRARRAALAAVARAGGAIVPLPGGEERGLLLRLAGPRAGTALALRLAAAVAAACDAPHALPPLAPARIATAMQRAASHGARLAPALLLERELALLASGGYAALAGNLALKLVEGLLLPPPPCCDVLEFAHGPFQRLADRPATVLALARRGAPGEPALFARAARMLDRRRHRLVRLPATLPGAQALLEHEAALDALIVRAIAERRIDQGAWPGRGRDAPLYAVRRPVRPAPRDRPPPPARQLAALTWPELAAARRAGCDTAVVPLGATEQHGPHLPFATDTLIAEALAARFCARVPEAIAVPALPLGCSAEHGGFPGTLSLRWETLRAVLGDVLAGLAAQGFRRVVVFSAHGGNDALLRADTPALARAAAPAQLVVCAGLDTFAARWRRASAAFGIDAAASGQHAGEFETSLLLGLHPQTVRRAAVRRGRLAHGDDAQALFYPDLRAHAASGVVGDPRRAAGARAAAYLDAWVDALLACYVRAKKRTKTNQTQNA